MSGLSQSQRARDVLESLYEHRLLTTAQLHAMHAWGLHPGRIRMTLNDLAAAGFAERVWTSSRRSRIGVWFATERGVELVRRAHVDGVARPRLVMSPQMAAGPLQSHTLGVNDVGIAFLQAARARGDECGPLDWSHEVAHRIADGRHEFTAGSMLTTDAVLKYAVSDTKLMLYRFIELDRATRSSLDLAEKLHRYVRLRDYEVKNTATGRIRAPWRDRYPIFPPVIVVFAGKSRSALAARLETALALCARDPRLKNSELAVFFVLLEDLVAHGPFATIFSVPEDPYTPVDFLRRAAWTSDDLDPLTPANSVASPCELEVGR
jgi:hypothetical protein